jgi:hypothetical protein
VAWTSDDLIAEVRVRAQVPDEGPDSEPTDAEILQIADQEIGSRFMNLIRETRANYLVTSVDVELVADTATYRIPRDSHASSLRELWLIGPNGEEAKLDPLDLTDGHVFGGSTGQPRGYYLRGHKVVVLPTPSAAMGGWSLRMFYYRRPSKLVPTSACVQVLENEGDGVFHIPYAWTTAASVGNSMLGEPVDFVQADPPFDLLADNETAAPDQSGGPVTIASIDGEANGLVTITLAYAPGQETILPGDTILRLGVPYTVETVIQEQTDPDVGAQLVVGPTGITTGAGIHFHVTLIFADTDDIELATPDDWLCLHMETCIPQLPDALWPALVVAVAAVIRKNEADWTGAKSLEAERDELLKHALGAMQPRVDGRAKAILNASSPLRRWRR